MNDDTGNRRRETDKVSTDAALELVCTLAYENALAGGDGIVIASVEAATLKLRELKVQETGRYPALKLYDPDHDPSAPCVCGHPYHRHFDSYEDWAPVGCKYCECRTFNELPTMLRRQAE